MFDYNLIDAIDPKYLEQFLCTGLDGHPWYRCPKNGVRTIEHNGKTYTFRFDLSFLDIWNEFSYDLLGYWERGAFNCGGKRGKELHDKGNSWEKVQAKLEEHTLCYDLLEAEMGGKVKVDTWHGTEYMILDGVEELTHEQVRQRVLCFAAMLNQLEDEAALGKVIDACCDESGAPKQDRMPIAQLSIYYYYKGTAALSSTVYLVQMNKKELLIRTGGEYERVSDLASKIDLFEMPMVSKEAAEELTRKKKLLKAHLKEIRSSERKKKMEVNAKQEKQRTAKAQKDEEKRQAEMAQVVAFYNKIDTETTLEDYASIIQTDTKGKRSFVCEKDREISVKGSGTVSYISCKLSKTLKDLWKEYEEVIEPNWKKREKHSYCAPERVIDKVWREINTSTGKWYTLQESGIARGADILTQDQVRRRCLWFARACSICSTDEGLRRVAQMFPKNSKRMRLATLYYTKEGTILELVAQYDTYSAVVKVREVLLKEGSDMVCRIKDDAAMTTDLFDFVK